MTSSPYLTTPEAASFLRLRPCTLERWRCAGGGPVFHKFGGRVVYAKEALERFAEENRRSNTAASRCRSRRSHAKNIEA